MESRTIIGIVIALIVGIVIGYCITPTVRETVTQTRYVTTTVLGTPMRVIKEVTLPLKMETMTTTVTSPQKVEFNVKLSFSPEVGFYLTDGMGRTLYFFAKDYDGKSKCYDGCADNWPPFYFENLNPSPGLDKDDFGVIQRDDGSMQLSYKGWPLYYFAKDIGPGEIRI